MKRVEIDLNAVGLGAITLDGHDVSTGVRGVTFRSEVGNLTEVTLDMVVRQGARASGEAQVIIPDDTAKALRVLGWTPPVGAVPDHPWQEHNAHGNTCQYPGCALMEKEHTERSDHE